MRESEVPADGGEEVAEKKDFGKSIKDFPIALLTLFKNPTYVFGSLASCTEAMVVSGFTTFLPKIIENQFQQTAGTAAIVAGKQNLFDCDKSATQETCYSSLKKARNIYSHSMF